MSIAERTSLATHLKTKGNALFSKKSFREAIECYSQAIAVSPSESAVFYSNRAACASPSVLCLCGWFLGWLED